jgi:hypothetical protein
MSWKSLARVGFDKESGCLSGRRFEASTSQPRILGTSTVKDRSMVGVVL